MTKRILLLSSLLISSLFYGQSSLGTEYKLSANSQVSFLAIGKPGFIRIHGEGAKAQGNMHVSPKNELVDFLIQVPVASFQTGIDLRDKHMKDEFLAVNSFPMAILQPDKTTFKAIPLQESISTEIPALLTLRGVTKPVTVTVNGKKSQKCFSGEASFKIAITEFQIKIPVYLGVTMADTVTITSQYEWEPMP